MRFLGILKLFVNNPDSIYEAQEHAVSVLLLVLSASLLSDNLADGLFAKIVTVGDSSVCHHYG